MTSWEAAAALTLALLAVAGFWLRGGLERRAAAGTSLPPAVSADSLARQLLERELLRRTGPLAINAADEEALVRLEGIGPTLAGRIVAERASGGPYRSREDLAARVRGLGPAVVERLGARLVFSDTLEPEKR